MEKLDIVFDVDSTILKSESLEILAEILLAQMPFSEKAQAMQEIEKITNLGMEGKIDLTESVAKRMALFPNITEKAIQETTQACLSQITDGIKELFAELRDSDHNLFIVSGGFDFLVYPIAEALQVPTKNVNCSTCMLDEQGKYMPTESKIQNSKIEAIKILIPQKNRKIIMIGDGATDLKTLGKIADVFIGYIEHAKRETVIMNAELVAGNTKQLAKIIHKIANNIF